MSSDDRAVVVDTVGSLLAVIASSIQDALRILMFADKRAWGSPEFEQLRLLEETLDEAKRDFQELPAFINGRFYYENDQQGMCYSIALLSLDENLRIRCSSFAFGSLARTTRKASERDVIETSRQSSGFHLFLYIKRFPSAVLISRLFSPPSLHRQTSFAHSHTLKLTTYHSRQS